SPKLGCNWCLVLKKQKIIITAIYFHFIFNLAFCIFHCCFVRQGFFFQTWPDRGRGGCGASCHGVVPKIRDSSFTPGYKDVAPPALKTLFVCSLWLNLVEKHYCLNTKSSVYKV